LPNTTTGYYISYGVWVILPSLMAITA